MTCLGKKMRIYRSFIYVLLFLGISLSASAQKGIPFISYVETREAYEAGIWSICQDDQNGMLFAGRKGLLRYDGNEWRSIPLPYLPLVVKQNPRNKQVYVLFENNYGYLKRDSLGRLAYNPLTYEGELNQPLSDIYIFDSTVVFYSNYHLSFYNSVSDVLVKRIKDPSGSFRGIVYHNNEIFVNHSQMGLTRIMGNLLDSSGVVELADERILFSLSLNASLTLIGTASGELFTFDGERFLKQSMEVSDYLEENVLSDAVEVSDSTYALSTLYGGVLILNRSDGKILYTLNYNSGIPDDEIYAISKDVNNGLWLSYEFGICRIDFGVPLADYSHYPGLEGLLTGGLWYEDSLYVSTTEGLYRLTEVKNYEEVEILLKNPKAVEAERQASRARETNRRPGSVDESLIIDGPPEGPKIEQLEEAQEGEKERKGLLKRIFRRNRAEDKTKETAPKEIQTDDLQAESSTEPAAESEPDEAMGKQESLPKQAVPKYIRKKISKLLSVDYMYKKIAGLNSRCNGIIETPYGLLVGASSGVYLVEEQKANIVYSTRNVHSISYSEADSAYYACSDEGVCRVSKVNDEWRRDTVKWVKDDPIFSVATTGDRVWAAGYDQVLSFVLDSAGIWPLDRYHFHSVIPEEMYLGRFKDTLFLVTNSRIRYYDVAVDSFLNYKYALSESSEIPGSEFSLSFDGSIKVQTENGIRAFHGWETRTSENMGLLNLFDKLVDVKFIGAEEALVIDDYQRIYHLKNTFVDRIDSNFILYLQYIANENKTYLNDSSLVFDPATRLVRLGLTAPYFLKQHSTLYQYKIMDRMEEWSTWVENPEIELYTEPGLYTIRIRAKNILDQVSDPLTVRFEVKSPFYSKTWFYLLFIPPILLIFFLLFYIRERKLRRDKRILEEKVRERTHEIELQKEKIELQKDEILAQKDDITSSIAYASRIQQAVLPAKYTFEKSFSDYFIFYRPRDIVSGDFYWISALKNKVAFAVADCTGHGVPGAFMSMLGNSFLNEITNAEEHEISAGKILDALRDKITDALSQSGKQIDTQDGMDMALCIYDKKEKIMEFSGAYNSIYRIRSGELKEFKADRMPIGYHPNKKHFKTLKIELQKNDIFYLFSDGYPDQFGGVYSKKLTTRKFKQILMEISGMTMEEQHRELSTRFDLWSLDNDQVDDVLVLGVKI